MKPQQIAQLIPTRWRQALYSVIGLAIALEAIWDVVPTAVEGKWLATISALGFGVALSNTGD